MNHTAQSAISRVIHGLSSAALMRAWFDWATHIMSCAKTANKSEPCIMPLPQDSRFSDDAWQMKPFNMVYQGFLLQQQWWHNVVTDVPGVTGQHERELQFLTRQMLDMYSPSNFLPTNPEILRKTRDEAGQNLIRGMQNLVEDAQSAMTAGARPTGAEGF